MPKGTGRVAIAVYAAVVGLGLGAAVTSGESQPATATPTTKTETVTVSVVPDVCTQALDDADTLLAAAVKGFDIVADSMAAVSEFDIARIEANTEKLNTLADSEVGPARAAYDASSADCRAKS